ncbi:MAG: hypothetical protein ACXVZV_04280 [Terriglobales bacterium]
MFCNVVCAYTCVGGVTVAPSAGVDTHTEPADVLPGFGAGMGAGAGKGATPVCGPALISTCTVGHVLGGGDGEGEGAGVGVVTPPVDWLLELPPQPLSKENTMTRTIKTGAMASRRI